jgi:4-hydroxyphenylacetate 3-monooxygenase
MPNVEVVDETGARIAVSPTFFTIAGYTGRDRAHVEQHIEELEAIGIPRPPSVPMYYPMPLDILTTADAITVASRETSGEVEPVLIVQDGAVYLGVGSDHTARDMERIGVAESKAACPKPIGPRVHRIDREALRSGALETLRIESAYDGAPYQHGSVADMLPLEEIFAAAAEGANAGKNGIIFCGTVPLAAGAFVYGRAFAGSISGFADGTRIDLAYSVNVNGAA